MPCSPPLPGRRRRDEQQRGGGDRPRAQRVLPAPATGQRVANRVGHALRHADADHIRAHDIRADHLCTDHLCTDHLCTHYLCPTASSAAADVASQPVVLTAFRGAATTPVSLCVGVLPLQQGSDRGQAAQWEVGAWTEGGNVPDVRIQLTSTAGAGPAAFSFGCAAGNGTPACDLGAVDASSAQRLLQAQVTVSLTAMAVSLSVTGSAANLAMDPAPSASVVVLASAIPGAASTTPLPTIAASGFAFPTPTASSGGNAADLFPLVAPGSPQAQGATPVANVSRSPVPLRTRR